MAFDFRQKRRKGLFGAPATMDTQAPPIVPQQPPQAQMGRGFPMEQPEQDKPGLGTRLLGEGWENKAFALGGVMQGDPRGAYMLQQRQDMAAQQAAQAADEQRKRSMDLADYGEKLRMKQDIEGPEQTALMQNYEWLVSQGRKKEADDLIGRSTQNVQWVRADNGDGTFTMVPVGAGGPQAPPPARPVGGLRPMGGTGGNVGGGF